MLGLAGRFQVMMADDAGECVPERTHVGYVGSPSGGRGGGAESQVLAAPPCVSRVIRE